MRGLLLSFGILCAWGVHAGGPGAAVGSAPLDESKGKILKALILLEEVATGRKSLNRAKQFWGYTQIDELARQIRIGAVSRTDAVLTRQYDPETGGEIRKREVSVVLNGRQGTKELALDLVHELVHATTSPGWDPYDPDLTAGRYIQMTIEGPGGEVEAMVAECEAGREIGFTERCERWFDGIRMDAAAIRRDFYRVGAFEHELLKKLGSERKLFPFLSSAKPELYSSTGGAPYPVSLYHEYESMREVACDNTKRRLETHRDPASLTFLERKCPDGTGGRTQAAAPVH